MNENNQSPGLMPDIDEQAAVWDARLRAADCTAAERQAFRAWCEESPEHQARFDELQAALGDLRAARNLPEIRSMREAALDASRPKRWQRPATQWAIGVAAGVGIIALGLLLFDVNMLNPGTAEPNGSPVFATAVGERSTTNLADGTVAVLNTNTRIRVMYTADERLVTLLQGQALFDVAKNPDRPFVVIAGDQRITAIGTVFDVRFENEEVKVTLVEGVVDVVAVEPIGSSLNGPATNLSQPPVRLVAGQQLSTPALASPMVPTVNDTDVERETIWRQGRVFFEDAPLSEALAEMNRYSTTQIVVNDPALDALRVNGMFRTGQQANFIDALETYFPVETERSTSNQILLKAR